jgi:hypothetical protein
MFFPVFSLQTRLLGVLLALFMCNLGCAALRAPVTGYGYFSSPRYDDAWSAKIGAWQRRERAEYGAVSTPPIEAESGMPELAADRLDSSGDLRDKYFVYRAERKRETARSLADWIQAQAKAHYFPDGPSDHWATLEETLERGGDDCDGLELLTFHALRDLGFSSREVYRAIVYRPDDGQHHMVTLWFEEQGDPWVIDPTGAMTLGMPRMSSLPDWVPIKVFSDTTEYTVHESSVPGPVAGIWARTP